MDEPTQPAKPARERTLTSLVESYLTERIRSGELSTHSARNNRGTLYRFAHSYGNRRVSQLSRTDVDRWLASRPHIGKATRRAELSHLKMFCAWLVRRRHIRINPTEEIPPVRIPRRLPRALPANAVGRLLAACPDERAVLICLLEVQEGLRCAEVARLQVGDVDFLGRTIRVIGKGGHERVLPVSDETWMALGAYLTLYPATSGALIRSYVENWRGLKPQTLSHMVTDWMSAAGIKRVPRDGVSGHALRHTMATDALRNGAHLRDVQAALGHAHLRATEVYLPLVVHDLRDALGGRKYRGA